ncbi:uncharacterized protein SOCG_00153 [Schizosaccharomyces octosporus yFS286]|uniref:Uncharacterized protein n=1 Tax=Schizosaccharomyces octosporus (strain yFS286) TaxID=483514 RepID=S9RE76_SCHOY|nr:uncharacterized protein SOCG_00153 [Schizosaccharomyces octosporus yFS286]EPX72389.1 hypothetical protein SOCG_00153 [Schizosaccharomyces octosporus yFS286]
MAFSTKDPYVQLLVNTKFEQVFRSLPKSKFILDASETIKQNAIQNYEPGHKLIPPKINHQYRGSKPKSEKKEKRERIEKGAKKRKRLSILTANNVVPISPSMDKASRGQEENNFSFDDSFNKEEFTTPIRNPSDNSQQQFMSSSSNLGTKGTDVQNHVSPSDDINIFDDSDERKNTKESRNSSAFSSSKNYKANPPNPQFLGNTDDELPLKEKSTRNESDTKNSKTELRKLQTFGKLFMKEGKRRESPTL